MKNRYIMIIEKPWGKEEIIERNNKYMLKKLSMFEGKRCSLQYHNEKIETIYVLFGKLLVHCGSNKDNLSSIVLDPYQSITIPAKLIHRMEAIKNCVYLEVSTPEIDDVVRLEDDYKRV